jgi:hypothetical protein
VKYRARFAASVYSRAALIGIVLVVAGCGRVLPGEVGGGAPRRNPGGLTSDAEPLPSPTIASDRALLQGTVRDVHGLPVRNAVISILSLADPPFPIPEAGIATDSKGSYSWAVLAPGPYRVLVSHPHYRKAAKVVSLKAARATTLNFVLKVE